MSLMPMLLTHSFLRVVISRWLDGADAAIFLNRCRSMALQAADHDRRAALLMTRYFDMLRAMRA